MYRILFTLLLLVLECGTAAAAEAKPFAPCAPLSQAAIEMLQTTGWNPCQGIPDLETVGIPPYPGAQVTSVSAAGTSHPAVTLLSADPVAKVAAFYTPLLTPHEGWKWNDALKILFRGDSVLDAITGKVPSVQIFDVSGEGDSFFSVAKAFRSTVRSRIVIHYAPRRTEGAAK
jgi:hypothetical protein